MSNSDNVATFAFPPREAMEKQCYALAVAQWNSDITFRLRDEAVEMILKAGVKKENIDIVYVPGTIELTYAAARLLEKKDESGKQKYDGVIVIGVVIKGDTPHFDYVCQSVTEGVTSLNEKAIAPVVFCVLTVLNKQQALDRAGGVVGEKGREAAEAAITMANIKW